MLLLATQTQPQVQSISLIICSCRVKMLVNSPIRISSACELEEVASDWLLLARNHHVYYVTSLLQNTNCLVMFKLCEVCAIYFQYFIPRY